MPTVSLDVTRSGWGGDIRQIEGAIISLQEYLFWILQVLDSGNVKYLNTNRTVIRSEDRTTLLDGSQIKMLDDNDKKRLVMGYNPTSGEYEFELSNAAGAATVTIDSIGNAVFKGKITASDIDSTTITTSTITSTNITGGTITADTTINVGETATIGKSLRFRDIELESESNPEVIGGTLSIYNGDSPTILLRGEGSRPIRLSTESSIYLDADAGIYDGNGTEVALKTNASGSFVSQDGKTVTVLDGIITSIN